MRPILQLAYALVDLIFMLIAALGCLGTWVLTAVSMHLGRWDEAQTYAILAVGLLIYLAVVNIGDKVGPLP